MTTVGIIHVQKKTLKCFLVGKLHHKEKQGSRTGPKTTDDA